MPENFSAFPSAQGRNRTSDIWIFSPPFYQLKYLGLNAIHSAGDRDRTDTGITTHGILSPGRLPVPPRRQFRKEWVEVDSNHRSIPQQIYSLSPLATRESTHKVLTREYINTAIRKKQALFSVFFKAAGGPFQRPGNPCFQAVFPCFAASVSMNAGRARCPSGVTGFIHFPLRILKSIRKIRMNSSQ